MDSVLRRLQSLPVILKRKQRKRWHRQQSKHNKISSQIYETAIQSSSVTSQTRMEKQTDQQRPGIGQFSRCFNSTDAHTKFRQWERIQANLSNNTIQTESAMGLPFKIVSYNILAQDLLVEHLHLYKLCNQLYLKWKYRLSRLTEEILAQRPDILCLQEVQENHLGDIVQNLTKKLPLGYLFKKKTGFKSDGCAIFYNKNLFELVTSDVLEYYQPGCELLDRHNIALIAKLRCKSKPEVTFLVCTTHLLYNPKRQDVRLAQIVVLLAELDRHSVVEASDRDKLQRMPIILTGDFNFKPDSAPFKLIANGKLWYEGLSRKTLTELDGRQSPPVGKCIVSSHLGITDNCQHIDSIQSNYKEGTSRLHVASNLPNGIERKPAVSLPELFSTGTLTHGLNLKSVYDHFSGQSYGSTFQNQWITVDHLFYSEPEQGSTLKLLAVYQLPLVRQCYQIKHLPNAELGSDHLLLASHFYLNFSNKT